MTSTTPRITRKIALEEHFAIEETVQDSAGFVPPSYWPELKHRLLDIQQRRIEEMDRHGIETMILSLNAPTIQAIANARAADELARRANDFLADQIARRPDRFRGFAALPMQSPELAARELERCVRELGFVGALVNGFTQVEGGTGVAYYDQPQYRPFWGKVQELDRPFYLHPRNPLPAQAPIYEGHSWLLGPTWAFGQETAVHALRLMGSGLFDQYPDLKIILGHMGEGLPYSMWRIDHRNGWVKTEPSYPAKKRIADYFRQNFWLTTSGNFRTQTLIDAMLEIGSDRILFSADWPFENIDHASDWFETASISENDRIKIGRSNAAGLFKLGD
ncbi:amidohydrolase [Herbaspirillum rubrisubalbicans]|nr:amidohydrolase family protein [Herbaspirillum rubrisubalbicans]NQE49972.1 amidohydrolase [Herbaspirillum rubrisubalbicans]